uniref:Ig-like domain-containing protein n=1 Tax=Maylandia zebra TaxID=106582 RepID=A0A3P9D0G8_9CICH
MTTQDTPTVILEPSWPQIYSSETVTVRCEGSQSLFVWRDGTLIRPPTSEYIISRATEADSGGYSCCTMSLSVCSDIITLTVSCDPGVFFFFFSLSSPPLLTVSSPFGFLSFSPPLSLIHSPCPIY